ncbi:MAG: 50S ribosomal protein L18 [Pseudomonadota bacterium]|nr:50S ribosomal protein L18 [Pseudomonadota bacterium]
MIRAIQGKKESRLKRAVKTRKRICETADHRVSVFKSGKHIYAQLSTSKGDKVITIISTNQKKLKTKIKSNNIENSKIVGKEMAEFIKKQKITKVAFDRSGYKYHGKVKALADAIRENGVKI